jgi:hypothetical protein
MKNSYKTKLTLEEELSQFLKNPELAPFKDQITRFITGNYGLIPYHTSYLLNQKDRITEMVEKLLRKTPNLTLSVVMSKIFRTMPDNMHPKLVKELTQHLFDEYERINSYKTELATTA